MGAGEETLGRADYEDDVLTAFETKITQAVYDVLKQSGYHEMRQVDCEYSYRGGLLILRGRVSSYYMKQVAQTVVKVIEQVYEIKNLVTVDTDR